MCTTLMPAATPSHMRPRSHVQLYDLLVPAATRLLCRMHATHAGPQDCLKVAATERLRESETAPKHDWMHHFRTMDSSAGVAEPPNGAASLLRRGSAERPPPCPRNKAAGPCGSEYRGVGPDRSRFQAVISLSGNRVRQNGSQHVFRTAYLHLLCSCQLENIETVSYTHLTLPTKA